LVPGGRITAGHAFSITGISPFVGAEFAIVVVVCSIWLIRVKRFALDLIHDWLPGTSASILALGYTVTIVAGRSMERGIASTLSNNSYYAYIFTLFCLMAYSHLVVAPSAGATGKRTIVVRRLLLAALGAIAITGGSRIYFIHRAMYATYSGPMRELFRRIEVVEAQHGGEPDFSFSLAPDCSSLFDLSWFAPDALEKHQRYTVATALFPHSERSQAGKYIIECPKP